MLQHIPLVSEYLDIVNSVFYVSAVIVSITLLIILFGVSVLTGMIF